MDVGPCHIEDTIFGVTKLFLGKYSTHVYSSQIGNPQKTKVQKPAKSNLVSQWVLLGLLIGAEKTQRCITKAFPSIGDSFHLETWSTLHSMQRAHRVEKCSFQVAHLVWTCRQLFLSESLLCSSALLFWEGLLAFNAYSGRERPSESEQIQGLSQVFWVVYFPA